MSASDLERGKFFSYKGEVLQVQRRSLVNVGTHSHTKLVITACDINGRKERDIILGHNDRVDLLDIMKKRANVISLSHGIVQIMDPETYETLDAACEPDILATLSEGDEVTYVQYNGTRVLGKKKS